MKWTKVAAIVFIVLVILLALVLAVSTILPDLDYRLAFGGGVDTGVSHTFGEALHAVRQKQAEGAPPSRPPAHVLQPRQRAVIAHGGANGGANGGAIGKNKIKPWTECATWDEVFEKDEVRNAYWDDVTAALNDLDLDWSDVRAELGDKLYDNREWAGRINLVNGKPKIVELVPSPHAVGEGPLTKQAAAMVPAEVIEALERKPALFMFHTHPGEVAGSATPSPIDVAGALWIAYTGRFAADLVISPYGVLMYGPNPDFRLAVWGDDNTAEEAQLNLCRRIADVLAAMEGTRSWVSPWYLETFASTLRGYNVDYIVFPTDKYAYMDRRSSFTSPAPVDHESLHDYHKRIRELEDEAEGAKVKAKRSRQTAYSKRVRFADPPARS